MTEPNTQPAVIGIDMAAGPDRCASTLIVTAPHRLTAEQRERIRASIVPNLPVGVGFVLLDGGLTAQTVGRATLRRWSSKRLPFNRAVSIKNKA